ncbi:MAG: DUF2182 domain-containing protein [Pseudomonadota bacterium]
MNMRLSEWVDDPRFVTLMVAILISAALWVATWSVMGRMDMQSMPGMDMSGMDMSGMEMSDTAMPENEMSGMNMSGTDMPENEMPGMEMPKATMSGNMQESMPTMGDGGGMWGMSMDPTDWRLRTISEASLMWILMMGAMMLPAMAPVMAIYSGVAAKEDRGARLALRIGLFTLGYFALWAVFSVTLAMVQLGLRGSEFFTMGGTQATPAAAAALLVAAGLYQLSPIKDACLRHCRHPLTYLLSHWREGVRGAFAVGANHGIYCVGCCAVFMGLMFVFGAMNIWWMAVIALYFLAEKIAPQAERWGRWMGYALIVAGFLTAGNLII